MSEQQSDLSSGLFVSNGVVKEEWIDINGHMNVAYYVLAFDQGVDALWSQVGITDEYIESRQQSTFAVESHVTYQKELKLGERFRIVTKLLAIDEKRLHQLQYMLRTDNDSLVATAEWLNLHVDLAMRRVCPWPDEVLTAFLAVAERQSDATLPLEVGSTMKVRNPLYAIDGYCNSAGDTAQP